MKRTFIVTVSTITCLCTAFVLAQSSGGDFEITKSSVDNGGGVSVGGQFALTGTIGQPDANHRASSGGGFSLAGGFWAKAHDVIFKSGFEGG